MSTHQIIPGYSHVEDFKQVDERSEALSLENWAKRETKEEARSDRRHRLGRFAAVAVSAIVLVSPAGKEQILNPITEAAATAVDVSQDVLSGGIGAISGNEQKPDTDNDNSSDGIPA